MTASAAAPDFMEASAERHGQRRDPAAGWGRLCVTVILIACAASVVADFRMVLGGLMVVAFGAAVVGLWNPLIGLLGISVLCTLDSLATSLLFRGGFWRWNTLNYWLLLVAILFVPLVVRRRDARLVMLVLLLVLLGFELAWSVDRTAGVQHVFGALSIFGLLVYFARASRTPEAWYWAGMVNAVTALGVAMAFMGQEARLPEVNPNVWSHAPVMGVLSACLAFAATPLPRGRRALLAALAAANGSVVFLTGSRGNLSITILGLLALTLMIPSLSQRVVILVATLLLSVAVISQFPDLEARTIGRLRILADPHESARRRTSGRFDLALGSWYIFQEHPMGVGTGSFTSYWVRLGRRPGMSTFGTGQPFAAHSAWVRALAENGVPGILLLGAFVASFAVAGLRRAGRLRVLGVLVTAALASGFSSSEFQAKSLWYVAAGATVLLQLTPARRRRVPVTLGSAERLPPARETVADAV